MKIFLFIVGVTISLIPFTIYFQNRMSKNESKPWPPYVSKCPEYWNVSPNSEECVNNTNKNKVPEGGNTIPIYDGTNLIELKQRQGQTYYNWDGISNINI